MSDVVEGQESTPEQVQEEAVNVEALVQRVEALENSKDRLLQESKQWKAKYQTVKNEVETKETEALAQSNDFKGLYEKTAGQVEELKSELLKEKKSKLETGLKYEVAKYGKDAEDVDILLAAVRTKKRDVVGFDAEAETWQGVDSAIDELRKSNPGLFRQTIPGTETGRPNAALPKEKSIEERIYEAPNGVLEDALKELLS